MQLVPILKDLTVALVIRDILVMAKSVLISMNAAEIWTCVAITLRARTQKEAILALATKDTAAMDANARMLTSV